MIWRSGFGEIKDLAKVFWPNLMFWWNYFWPNLMIWWN